MVVLNEAGALGDERLLERIVDGRGQQALVDPPQRCLETPSGTTSVKSSRSAASFSGSTSGP